MFKGQANILADGNMESVGVGDWGAGNGAALTKDTDAQATGGGYNTILCDNSTDIVTATGTIVEFLYDGTSFKAWIVFSE